MRLALALAVALLACSSDDPDPVVAKSCASGQQIECACPAGGKGAQVCRADGSGYDACQGCAGAGGACTYSGKARPPVASCVRNASLDDQCARWCLVGYDSCDGETQCQLRTDANGQIITGYCCDPK